MKKIINFGIIALALIATVGLNSCNKKKKLAKTVDPPKGETEIIIPCSGPDYFSTNKYFRANAVGESMDQNTSKRKALSEAKSQLAGSISTTMKVVGDDYVKSSNFNNTEEFLARFEQNSRTVINQELNGIRTICEKLTKTPEGNFKTYIAIELSGEDLVRKYRETLSKDETMKIDFNYEQFKKTFDAEMDKFSEGRR